VREKLIEDYGLIGNMRSAALVSVDGSIDFFCFPRFDSPTVFAALLDKDKGGFFSIQPQLETVRFKQLYLPDSNILLTRFLCDESVVELTDFMPVEEGAPNKAYAHQIIRMLCVVKGDVTFRMRCAPRFDYARAGHQVSREEEAICFRPEAANIPAMALHATVPLDIDGSDAVAEFSLTRGQSVLFAFGSLKQEEITASELLDAKQIQDVLNASSKFWREWLHQSTYRGRWREIVNRSALALKLLSSQEHGATVAAVTFGLPEKIGSTRNWDYRFTWLRDSSFSLYALIRLGFSGEVHAYTTWLRERLTEGLKSNSEDGPLRILYRLDGASDLDETNLDHLSGYRNSKPVRIGNAAVSQLQLDIYGEIMDAVYLSNKYSAPISKEGWQRVIRLMDWLSKNWDRPDEGIWEVRSGRKHLLHSRLMCWVAFDRVIRLANKRSLDAPIAEWLDMRRRIDDDILTNFWNDELQSFVQAKGETAIDASLLLMPMLRYISPTDPRWLSTLDRIESCLVEEGLVRRYASGTDGIEGEESSFTACSFWYIECLARAGRIERARLLFDKILGYANHLGLYSEQLGSGGEHLGNFPQALTHLALISAATYLDRRLDGIKETWS
jgi:GH15 family glucan-1,4-alpha-glucosidase